MADLLALFNSLDSETEKGTTEILRAPFGYAGSKLRSLSHILPFIPYSDAYIEPFGGSGSVLLNRKTSKLEVFNDRHAGVVAFYRCMRDPELTQKLIDWIDWTIHSKEDFIFCKATWKDVNDPVERAGRWLYMAAYSFSGVGRNWGRAKTGCSTLAGKLANRLPIIWQIHNRFRRVQVENQNWYECISYYDSPDSITYCDPPYLDTDKGCYEHGMSVADHKRLLDTIFDCQGFVAISGYPNDLYEKYKWSDRYEYTIQVSAETGNLDRVRANKAKEVLWIKD